METVKKIEVAKKQLCAGEYKLIDLNCGLSKTSQYFLSLTVAKRELLQRFLSVTNIAQVFKSRKIVFNEDEVIIKTSFQETGREAVLLFDPDLPDCVTQTFQYTIEPVADSENKFDIAFLRSDGRIYGKYIFDIQAGVLVTADVFVSEIYSFEQSPKFDNNDIVLSNEMNLMKAGCWYDSFLGNSERWKDEYGSVYKDVRYGENERDLLDVYVPKNLNATHENGVIISIHGGGWTSGDKDSENAFCTKYAKLGYVTAAINYSYINLEKRSTMFTIFDEVIAALSKIKAMSDEHGWNITKAALSGGSAGAHISMMHAYANNRKGALPVLFVAEQVGPIDMRYDAWTGLCTTTKEIYLQYASAGIGQNVTLQDAESGKFDEELLRVSPINFVGTAVPTVMAHGLCDSVVNPQNGAILSAKLRENGIEHDYFECPNCNHLMACDKHEKQAFDEKVKVYLKKYFGY